jgi:hypothetical protein
MELVHRLAFFHPQKSLRFLHEIEKCSSSQAHHVSPTIILFFQL